MKIVVSDYMCNLSAVRRITKESLKPYPDIVPGRGPADYVLAWGDPVYKCKYGVAETGFFWDAMHIDTIGLYANCSLNSVAGNKAILSYRAPKPARDIVLKGKLPTSKYRQVGDKVSWDGVVLPLQNPSDRSVHRGSSTEDYYKFVEGACKTYGRHLFLKLHPWNKGDVEQRFTKYAKENGSTIGRCDHSILEKCKFALVYNSTFVVDCLIRNIPIAQYAPGYFWQVPGVTYTGYTYPDSVCFDENLAQKTCDFLVWRYCFNQGMEMNKWVKMIKHFAVSNEIFPMTEEYSYGAMETEHNKGNVAKIERDKYIKIYRGGGKYGHSNHVRFCKSSFMEYLKFVLPDTIIDVGTGGGEFCMFVEDLTDANIVGIDFASFHNQKPGECVYINDKIGFINGSASDHSLLSSLKSGKTLLTSFDVLEHLPLSLVESTVSMWSEITQHICGTVSHQGSIKSGIVLHPTVKPREWWVDMMRQYFDNIKLIPIQNGRVSYYENR